MLDFYAFYPFYILRFMLFTNAHVLWSSWPRHVKIAIVIIVVDVGIG